MRKFTILLFFSVLILRINAQGIYNNGAHIVVSGNTYVVVNGNTGNVLNENGVIDLTGKLKLGGNFTNNTATTNAFGTLASGSEVIFAGDETQTIGGSTTAVFTFDKLTINSGTQVRVAAGKQLTLNGDLTNNGTLIIGANDEEQSTVKISGSVSDEGVYKVETNLTAGRNWYVSSPVSGAKSSVFDAASNPVYWYDEVHGSTVPWALINDNITDLTPMKGYIATVPTTGNVTFTGGTLNNTDETLTVYRTAGQTKEGFNLVGNPYPAYFDFDAATKQDIMETMWYRSRNEANTGWVFDTYNTTTNLGVNPSGKTITGKVPPMQAFWVRVSPSKTSGTINFAKSFTSHIDNAGNIRRAPKEEIQQFVRLRLYKEDSYDETIVAFFPKASDESDNYDSPKMLNASATVPDIYSIAGNESMAINSLKKFEGERRIPLFYDTQQNGNFKISAKEIMGFSPMSSIGLYDVALGKEHNLLLDGDYEFSSESVKNMSRFELIVKVPSITTGNENVPSNDVQFLQQANNFIEIRIADLYRENAKYRIHNAIGQVLQTDNITQNSSFINLPYTPGIYNITLIKGNKTYYHNIIIK
ncbi:MAG: hypothetical protein H6Q19_990 [Bacteroidetes bacterium]|nr:hypothetical protein [Bacteroidota bacterium]